jgi:hypothetical protein
MQSLLEASVPAAPLTETALRHALVWQYCLKPDELTDDQVRFGLVQLMDVFSEFRYVSQILQNSEPEVLLRFEDPAFWRQMRQEFLNASSEFGPRWFDWMCHIEPRVMDFWAAGYGSDRSTNRFYYLARQCALKLGLPGGEAGQNAFLTLLRRERGGHFDERVAEFNDGESAGISGRISNIFSDAADFSLMVETRALEVALGSLSVPDVTAERKIASENSNHRRRPTPDKWRVKLQQTIAELKAAKYSTQEICTRLDEGKVKLPLGVTWGSIGTWGGAHQQSKASRNAIKTYFCKANKAVLLAKMKR